MTAKVLRDAKEALERLNTNRIVEIYTDTFLFEDISLKASITDRTLLKEYFQQLFSLPGVRFSDIRIFEAENFAAIEWTWSGMSPVTGKPYQVRGASVMELSNGRVSRESIYYDPKTYNS